MGSLNINHNLYRIFIAVHECRNISRAAKELFICQPNVSRSIKELEKQLGVKLFRINSRGVRPTSEGEELYDKAVTALAWLDYGVKNAQGFGWESTGSIKIACATNFAGYFLAKHIHEFNKKYPFIQFDIIQNTAEEAIALLGSNRVDLVLSTFSLYDKGKYERVELCELEETGFASEEFAVLHDLQSTIALEKFKKLPYILGRAQKPLKKPVAIVDSQEVLFQFVIHGLGVGFCAERFLSCNHPNDTVFKFKIEGHKPAKRMLSCIHSREYVGKATEVFLNALKGCFC